MHTKSIAYIITTGLVVVGYLAAGSFYLSGDPKIVEGFAHLGYGASFVTLLGLWKVAGAVAVAAPRLPRLKEWAYAGMVFNLTAAIYSHARAGDAAMDIASPAILLAFVVASWALRPASRKLSAAQAPDTAAPSAPREVRLAA